MRSESPYASPRTNPRGPLNPRVKRHYEVEGDLLRVREGAMLPDVCLYSGWKGDGLQRSTRRLLQYPKWFYWVFVFSFVVAFAFRRAGIALVGIGLFLLISMSSRRSAIIHLAYSRVALLLRAMASGLGAVFIFGTFKLADPLKSSYPMLYFLAVALVIVLAFLMVRRTGGFRVKRIHQGWVTLSGVHPKALETLRQFKEGESSEGIEK